MAGGRPPSHDLCIVAKDGDTGFQTVGVGWERDGDGAISLKLNRGVVLSWRDMGDHALYVFRRQQQKQGK